jgi:hypothetical protein
MSGDLLYGTATRKQAIFVPPGQGQRYFNGNAAAPGRSQEDYRVILRMEKREP